MKFKKGKLYKVVKESSFPNCVGCLLKYIGINKNGYHYGKYIKLGKNHSTGLDCMKGCIIFNWAICCPSTTKLVEYEGMVKFCKKLRKERKNETRSNS